MTTADAVRNALAEVTDPDIGKPLHTTGILGDVSVDGDVATVELYQPVAELESTPELQQRVVDAVGRLPDIGTVRVRIGVMSDEQRTALADGLHHDNPFRKPDSRTTVIGVASGKGGVGKSTVATYLAATLRTMGHRVGILDADIWGFSIPRMFGLRNRRPVAFSGTILPLRSRGVKVISIGFFLEREEEAVVWRGPMLHKALEQFLTDVVWGDDLEYLVIDLPPGTGDISISLATFLPGMGIAVVTTPQPVAQKVAERAANMSDKVKLKVLGVIENMSGLICEHCGESTPIFGSGGGADLAEALGVPLLGQIPLLPSLREASDAGQPFVWTHPDHPVTETYRKVAEQLAHHRPRRKLPVMQIGGR